jgi:hypothetical protein
MFIQDSSELCLEKPDLTLKSIKKAFNSKTCNSSLALVPQKEDNLNLSPKGRQPQFSPLKEEILFIVFK